MDFEEILQLLLGQNADTPVRRDLRFLITRDSEGRPAVEILGGETVALGREESINRLELAQDIFFSCGCPRSQSEIGAQCGECGRISCASCATRCANPNCRRPLCIFHVTHFANTEGSALPFCETCFEEVEWKSLVSKSTFGLIPPARF